MHKVCFIEMMYYTGPVVMQRLKEELCRLVNTYDQIEFWYTGCHNVFESAALLFILDLKKNNPEKEIGVVAVVDPVKVSGVDDNTFNEERDGFPEGSVTRIQYAPCIVGKSEKYANRFIEHSKKVDRWVWEQCDTMLAFRYENLPNTVNTEVNRVMKRTQINVISIFDPVIMEYVNDVIDKMEGREGVILRGLREGRTYNSLGEELGVTLHRINQIASKTMRHLFADVRRKALERK